MKKLVLMIALLVAGVTFAQEVKVNDNVTSENSWLKLGLNAGVPMGDVDDASSFSFGLELKGQHLVTPNFGIGLTTGYSNFFGKDGVDDFGVVPAAAFARYYFQPKGLFVGADFGYGFLTGVDNLDGGLYLNPQLGYHNDDWNFYAYYQNTFADNDITIQVLGVGVTYNIRF
ncbi:hypothetical protein M0G43_08660 [Subsaxibacter sp. CAU 1640]|uniref:hypothetical protein n=1 Tax=Subsaxibacter sp. CAU 1640 TaxID=2933271 RepID=UPI002004DDF5|nr:hypothetical protein [Subsaxibacter sp. CAU 1640]MCK7590642.1 hypothetical protein [Subsaxibacter sp. CAU 1640]